MREFDGFRLDTRDHMLWRVENPGEAVPVALVGKAFDVLRYFVERPGRLVTHEELLEALWSGVDVQPEVLKGYVLTIRNALGDTARAPRYIETQRGRGYRFIATVRTPLESHPVSSLRHEAPLVGRVAEEARLDASFRASAAGVAQSVFIRGESGIGKTALLEHFCTTAAFRGALIGLGRCIEGFGGVEPFYPVIEALSTWMRGPEAARIQHALVNLAPSWGGLLSSLLTRDRRAKLLRDPQLSARSRMIGEFSDFLEHLAQTAPVLLALEDIHWADHSTLDLISALARRRSAASILVICTLRSDDPSEGTSRFKQLIGDLVLHRLASEMELGPLLADDVATLIDRGGLTPVPEVADTMLRRSGGNPLFLSILLDDWKGAAERMPNDGPEATSGEHAAMVPAPIRALVESRIAALDADSRHVLEAASACGETFTPPVVASAAGMSVRRFEEICETLCRDEAFIRRRDKVQTARGDARVYMFRHALFREALLDRQGPLRLARIHALIAKELEAQDNDIDDGHLAFNLAVQFSGAQDWAKATRYLEAALLTAKKRFAHQDALSILDQADWVASHLSGADREAARLELLEHRGSIYAAMREPKALQVFAELVDMAARAGRVDVQARAEIGLAFVWGWKDIGTCVTHLERATDLAWRQSTPQLRARTLLSSASWRIWISGWNQALFELCEANLKPLRNGPDRQVAAWGMVEFSMMCLLSGRYREALETIDENVGILMRHAIDRPEFNIFRAIWMTHLGRPWCYLMLGEWGRSLEEFDASEHLFVVNANRYSICTLLTMQGLLKVFAGDFEGIRRICMRLGVYRDVGGPKPEPLYTPLLPNELRHCAILAGISEIGLGEAAAGIAKLEALDQEIREHAVNMDWYWRLLIAWTLGDAYLADSNLARAAMAAERMRDLIAPMEEPTWQVMALELSARVAARQAQWDAANAYVTDALTVVAQSGAPVAEWRVHSVAAEILHTRGRTDDASAHDAAFEQSVTRLVDSLPSGHPLAACFGAYAKRVRDCCI
ncbi:ATP-binding protein [Luteibacter sp. UNCMF366Tsu5.1]|uniref:ATP-binding protein n=1 Tax=Luteibacter sp. UNCMF366Tsu5.1 TaxID=1502758 RepID=UPI000908692A|nr:AAA family ATPase [Luteibacter sp. UNCMF366Tsu5.1]SFW29557.1 Transcriptional regulatory protein, C terminal [Luteibacter sp. UNCMF366Tsu5.1]